MLVTRFLWPGLLGFFLLFSGFVPSNSSKNLPEDTYRRAVEEVRLTFVATDEHNHRVDTLRKNDFAVVDDEAIIRDFRSFGRSGVMSLEVVILVDSSESVLPRFQKGGK
jgi:hypothetical protein